MFSAKKKISVIIPSRDEGQEPFNTVKSLFECCKPSQVEVIVVDDSWLNQDWAKMPKNVKVVKTDRLKGFPQAIERGILEAKHENLFITGARTRFTEGFVDKSIEALKIPGMYCGVSAILRYDQTDLDKAEGHYYGARIKYHSGGEDSEGSKWLGWILNYGNREKPETLECLYGGHYVTTKTWWNYIHGLRGILTRGGCNQFLSLKTRAAGGVLALIENMVIGNIYRDRTSYPVSDYESLFNRAFIMAVLFGYNTGRKVVESYRAYPQYQSIKLTYDRLMGITAQERHYHISIRKNRIKFN